VPHFVFQPLLPPQQSSSILLLVLSMELSRGSEQYVDAAIRPLGTCGLLAVTTGVLNPFPPALDDETAFYSRHFVSFKVGQRPLCHVPLSPRSNWTATQCLRVDPTQPHRGLSVTHWNQFNRDGSWRLEMHLWEVVFDFAPLVSLQIFRFFPYSRLTQYSMSTSNSSCERLHHPVSTASKTCTCLRHGTVVLQNVKV
jgi:hypothetical protein